MPKLRVFESISIDGFFTYAAGDIRWAHAGEHDPEFDEWVGANASKGGDLLFGRITYQMMASYWPTPRAALEMPTVAAGMNAARKHVASSTLDPTWNNSQRLGVDLVASVRALKAGAGPDITVLGSGSVVAQLGAARLVDEYQFVILPIALGAGRSVFTHGCPLRLIHERAFPSGRVVLTYAT